MSLKLKGIAEAVILGNGTPKEIYARAAILLVLGALEFGMGKFRVAKQVQDLDKRLAVMEGSDKVKRLALAAHENRITELNKELNKIRDTNQHLISRLNYLNGKVNR